MRSNRLALKLTDIQVMIEPAPIEQFLVRAALDDLAVIDHDHLIGIADGAEAVASALQGCYDQFLEERYGEDSGVDQFLRFREVAVAGNEELGIGRQRARRELSILLVTGKLEGGIHFYQRREGIKQREPAVAYVVG